MIPTCALCHREDIEPSAVACWLCGEQLRATVRAIITCLEMLDARPASTEPGRRAPGFRSTSPARDHVIAMLDPRSINRRVGPEDEDNPPINVIEYVSYWSSLIHRDCPRVLRWPDTLGDALILILTTIEWSRTQEWIERFWWETRTLAGQLRAAVHDSGPQPVGSCIAPATGIYGQTIGSLICGGNVFPVNAGARCERCSKTYNPLEMIDLTKKAAS